MAATRLILASASPRRRDLLDQLGVSYASEPPHIDESQVAGERATDYVQRMAREKALASAARFPAPAYAVLAADTIVVADDRVLGKPAGRQQARAMLMSLSGRWHSVYTAVCLSGTLGMRCELVETRVAFATVTGAMCDAYLDTPEPWDKAGAYAIQGLGGAFVRAIEGSYSNVVGLPLYETFHLLGAEGIATALTPASTA